METSPTTTGSSNETYTFIIENTNIVKFGGTSSSTSLCFESVSLRTQSINTETQLQ